jgi:hypothetical protein
MTTETPKTVQSYEFETEPHDFLEIKKHYLDNSSSTFSLTVDSEEEECLVIVKHECPNGNIGEMVYDHDFIDEPNSRWICDNCDVSISVGDNFKDFLTLRPKLCTMLNIAEEEWPCKLVIIEGDGGSYHSLRPATEDDILNSQSLRLEEIRRKHVNT